MTQLAGTPTDTARFFLTQASLGFTLGAIVAATMLALDAGGLRSLIGSTSDALPAVGAFVIQFGALFAALTMGAAKPG